MTFTKAEHLFARRTLLAAKIEATSDTQRDVLERLAAWHKQWADRTPDTTRSDAWKDAVGQTMANGNPQAQREFNHALMSGRLQKHTAWIDAFAPDYEYLGEESGKAVFRNIHTQVYLP